LGDGNVERDVSELVTRAASGDAEAFATLVEERQHRMTRLALAILGDPTDADDALQDWLVSVWRNLPGLRDAARFEAWSDRILVNACRRILRARARDRLRVATLPEERAESRPVGAADFEAAGVERDALERAFETLSAEDRAAVVLHHLDGRSVEEIASRLEVPVGTLKSRLHRARAALRRALEEEVS
jgi:RNA polymerase sigma-70 factor (ECF subfamily)